MEFQFQILTADLQKAGSRKFVLEEEKYNATNFLTLWDFEGVLKYTPLMAENSRMSKLSEKDDECIFSWKLFTAWDYMIGNAETAHNRVASIVMGFKEALLEEAEKKREARKWKVVCFRIFVNLVVLGLLSFSAYAVIMVVKRSTEKEANSTVWRKNEITIVMSLITLFFPMLFEVIGFLEQYHPRKQLRLQLARIMVLNLLNLYSLIFALFDKISSMTNDMQNFKDISCTGSTKSFNNTLFSDTDYDYSSKVFNDTKLLIPPAPVSYSLLNELVYNTSDITYPLLRRVFDNLTQVIIDLRTQNTSVLDWLTINYTENYTTENYTNSYMNQTFTNMSLLNGTIIDNFTDIDFSDIKDMFVDYLTYVLFNVNETNVIETNTTENDMVNKDYADSFEFIRNYLMSTFINDSTKLDEGDVYQELTTIYEETSSTTTSLENNLTTTRNAICPTAATTVTAVTTLPDSRITTTASVPAFQIMPGNYSMCSRLRTLCWETMFGQELIKLTVMDLIMTVLSTLAIDFFRGIFVRFMNKCWCWNLEKSFPQYGDFKVAENILHLVNNQGMVWMGMFFSPGLVVLNVVKLYIMMYFRAWAVLTCNVPHEVIFRASRSNNFYYALLLMMLFLCVLPVGYATVQIRPSWHCGPFSKYQRIFHIFTKTLRNLLPAQFRTALDYIASPGIVIPLLVLLILIIYYLISLTGALREANDDLKIQLRRERTEERRKMFQIVDRRRGGSGESNELSNTPFTKWKKLIGSLPGGKSFDDTPRQQSEDVSQPDDKTAKVENKSRDFLSKFIKRALRKSSTSEDEQNAEDGTDTEQHDSLPYDTMTTKQLSKPIKPSLSWGNSDFQAVVSKAVKANQRRLSNVFVESTDSGDAKNFPLQQCRDVSQFKRKLQRVEPGTSKDMRQDSGSSVWSDNIPVITISKTESDENILRDGDKGSSHKAVKNTELKSKFEPKIKCVLKKQSTEFDEDTICHFNKHLEQNLENRKFIQAVSEEDIERTPVDKDFTEDDNIDSEQPLPDVSLNSKTDAVSGQSSSEDTEFKEISIDTILNFPSQTEKHSSEEKTISDDSFERFS
ncbi:hypothetical protein NQ315_004599 [Exocentrus adspersus]|uniref:TMC domain-containing protein n=1 Tax=Exocentrus adspersus TaxID=1586481 RepID=A0AAV8VP91_9CUCU|nr:hypothetical protein NQ315_004599 [Exocentrus adspersus]